jgi:tripartite-type tricarboxylate transporter receptor subunit TctC
LCQKLPLAARAVLRSIAMTSVVRMLAPVVVTTFLIGVAAPVRSDDYANRPIHLIVNYVPGGTGDIIARLIGGQMAIELGQSVVVENRPGAGGTLGARDVVNAAPDGYTLTVAQTPEIAINPYFMKDVGYDPQNDLKPIALGGIVPLALVVSETAPYSTVDEFVNFLRTTDKPVTFASGGVGTSGHLAGELLKVKFNNRLVHVPYKGAGQALADVVAGNVDFYFPGLIAALPFVKAGKLKLLAMATTKPSAAMPDIPTMAHATGIRNFNFTLWAGLFGPRAMPDDIATKLNRTIDKIIAEPDIKKKLEDNGAEVSPMTIEQFSAFITGEIYNYQAVIHETNLKPE